MNYYKSFGELLVESFLESYSVSNDNALCMIL